MRKWYSELHDVNTDLIRGYNSRCKNHQELLDALKQLNVIIQKAAQLRGKLPFMSQGSEVCQQKQNF
jgi:Bardet-Biedl syndrome 2 protein